MNAYALLILAAATMALTHGLSKAALARLPLRTFLLVRAVAAFAFSLPWLGSLGDAAWTAPTLLAVGLSALLAPLAINAAFYAALRVGSVAAVSALLKTSPAFVLLLQIVVFHESASPLAAVGAAIITAGAVVLAWSGGATQANAVALGLAAAALHALSIVVQARALVAIEPGALIVVQNAVFLLGVGAFAAAAPPPREPPRRPATPWKPVALAAASGVLMHVVFDGLKYAALPETGPFVASCVLLLSVPFAAVLARVTLGERLPAPALGGVAAIVVGAVCSML